MGQHLATDPPGRTSHLVGLPQPPPAAHPAPTRPPPADRHPPPPHQDPDPAAEHHTGTPIRGGRGDGPVPGPAGGGRRPPHHPQPLPRRTRRGRPPPRTPGRHP